MWFRALVAIPFSIFEKLLISVNLIDFRNQQARFFSGRPFRCCFGF